MLPSLFPLFSLPSPCPNCSIANLSHTQRTYLALPDACLDDLLLLCPVALALLDRLGANEL